MVSRRKLVVFHIAMGGVYLVIIGVWYAGLERASASPCAWSQPPFAWRVFSSAYGLRCSYRVWGSRWIMRLPLRVAPASARAAAGREC